MTKKAKTWTCAGAALACVAAVLYFALRNDAPYEVEYLTAKVEKATIGNSVTATGTIEPVTEVEVGTQVSGMISHIYVDYNSVVKKGQVIAELDKTNLVSQLNSAKSQLASAQANLKYQQTNYGRIRTLHDKGLVSDDDFETARLAWQQAEESVKERQEAVSTAQTNLGYATITSPIDGTVLTKDVEEGQTVASSYSTPTLFTIAKDLRDMRVIADVDEADIGQVDEGQRVTLNDNEKYCVFARFCHPYGGVWDLTAASGDSQSRKLAVREASMCPSARLTAWDNRTGKPYEFIFEPSLGLIEDPAIGASGGLWVRGGIRIQREDGRTFEVRNRVVLCRCGHSRNKPYCDGAHAAVKWKDGLEGTPDGETLPRSVASAKIETH